VTTNSRFLSLWGMAALLKGIFASRDGEIDPIADSRSSCSTAKAHDQICGSDSRKKWLLLRCVSTIDDEFCAGDEF